MARRGQGHGPVGEVRLHDAEPIRRHGGDIDTAPVNIGIRGGGIVLNLDPHRRCVPWCPLMGRSSVQGQNLLTGLPSAVELVRTVADRVLVERLEVLECGGRRGRAGRKRQRNGEPAVRLLQSHGERRVVNVLEPGQLGCGRLPVRRVPGIASSDVGELPVEQPRVGGGGGVPCTDERCRRDRGAILEGQTRLEDDSSGLVVSAADLIGLRFVRLPSAWITVSGANRALISYA
jgi:hypothetical protein